MITPITVEYKNKLYVIYEVERKVPVVPLKERYER